MESQHVQAKKDESGFPGANREEFIGTFQGEPQLEMTRKLVGIMRVQFENQSIAAKAKQTVSVEGKNLFGLKTGMLKDLSPKNKTQLAPTGMWFGGQGEKRESPSPQSVGFEGIFSSPGGPYKGLVLVDVEKSIIGANAGSKLMKKDGAAQGATGLSWKRKERDEIISQDEELTSLSSQKKRGAGSEFKYLRLLKRFDR